MQIYFPSCSVGEIASSGSQSLRVEFLDDSGLPLSVIEISLDAALAITEHIRKNMKQTPHTESGWELK